jgi:hypothetical protein
MSSAAADQIVAQLPEIAKQVRKTIMDQVLEEGTHAPE